MKASTSVWLRVRRGWLRGPSASRFRVSSQLPNSYKYLGNLRHKLQKINSSETFVRLIPAPLFCTLILLLLCTSLSVFPLFKASTFNVCHLFFSNSQRRLLQLGGMGSVQQHLRTRLPRTDPLMQQAQTGQWGPAVQRPQRGLTEMSSWTLSW